MFDVILAANRSAELPLGALGKTLKPLERVFGIPYFATGEGF